MRRCARLFSFDLPYRERYLLIAGVDEVGRGPLAGPVVAAAVILPPKASIPKLNDSKKLTASQREKTYQRIHACALAIGVGQADHGEIDALNIYQAARLAMHRALEALSLKPTMALVDGRRIRTLPFPHIGIVRGDG